MVCLQKALSQAPFPYPGWVRPAVEVLPLPVPQFVQLRPGTLCTVVVDARAAGSGLFTLEAPFTASPEELLDRASLFLGNIFEEALRREGIQCFFNEVPWALPLKRRLTNGGAFCCRPALEGPGLPLLGPGGNRHTLQRRREAPYFEVLRAVELGSQTITLSFGDRLRIGASAIVRTRTGSRPGDSIADLLFSLVQADFLQAVRARVEALAATDPVLSSLELPVRSIIPVWADDAVVLLSQCTTSQLAGNLAHS